MDNEYSVKVSEFDFLIMCLCRRTRWMKTWRNYYLKEILMRKMMKKKELGDDNQYE